MSDITKEQIEHLAKLARIELNSDLEERLTHDLAKILDHFIELQELPERPKGMLKAQKQELRQDDQDLPDHFSSQEKIIKNFPDRQEDQLRIPPIFE